MDAEAWEHPSEETKERIAIFNAVNEHWCAEPPKSRKWTRQEVALVLKRFSVANELPRQEGLKLATEPFRLALRSICSSPGMVPTCWSSNVYPCTT